MAVVCKYFPGLFAFLFGLPFPFFFFFNMQKFKILLQSSQLTFSLLSASVPSKMETYFLPEM